jgi:hypothetical protein
MNKIIRSAVAFCFILSQFPCESVQAHASNPVPLQDALNAASAMSAQNLSAAQADAQGNVDNKNAASPIPAIPAVAAASARVAAAAAALTEGVPTDRANTLAQIFAVSGNYDVIYKIFYTDGSFNQIRIVKTSQDMTVMWISTVPSPNTTSYKLNFADLSSSESFSAGGNTYSYLYGSSDWINSLTCMIDYLNSAITAASKAGNGADATLLNNAVTFLHAEKGSYAPPVKLVDAVAFDMQFADCYVSADPMNAYSFTNIRKENHYLWIGMGYKGYGIRISLDDLSVQYVGGPAASSVYAYGTDKWIQAITAMKTNAEDILALFKAENDQTDSTIARDTLAFLNLILTPLPDDERSYTLPGYSQFYAETTGDWICITVPDQWHPASSGSKPNYDFQFNPITGEMRFSTHYAFTGALPDWNVYQTVDKNDNPLGWFQDTLWMTQVLQAIKADPTNAADATALQALIDKVSSAPVQQGIYGYKDSFIPSDYRDLLLKESTRATLFYATDYPIYASLGGWYKVQAYQFDYVTGKIRFVDYWDNGQLPTMSTAPWVEIDPVQDPQGWIAKAQLMLTELAKNRNAQPTQALKNQVQQVIGKILTAYPITNITLHHGSPSYISVDFSPNAFKLSVGGSGGANSYSVNLANGTIQTSGLIGAMTYKPGDIGYNEKFLLVLSGLQMATGWDVSAVNGGGVVTLPDLGTEAKTRISNLYAKVAALQSIYAPSVYQIKDAQGRVIQRTEYDPVTGKTLRTIQYTYSSAGNLVVTTAYDSNGKIADLLKQNYFPNGKLKFQEDSQYVNGVITSYASKTWSLLLGFIYTLDGTMNMTYDSAGRKTSSTEYKYYFGLIGVKICTEYDSQGRIKKQQITIVPYPR